MLGGGLYAGGDAFVFEAFASVARRLFVVRGIVFARMRFAALPSLERIFFWLLGFVVAFVLVVLLLCLCALLDLKDEGQSTAIYLPNSESQESAESLFQRLENRITTHSKSPTPSHQTTYATT